MSRRLRLRGRVEEGRQRRPGVPYPGAVCYSGEGPRHPGAGNVVPKVSL